MLSDQSKFLKADFLDNYLLKFCISQEKQFGCFLKSLKGKQKLLLDEYHKSSLSLYMMKDYTWRNKL